MKYCINGNDDLASEGNTLIFVITSTHFYQCLECFSCYDNVSFFEILSSTFNDIKK